MLLTSSCQFEWSCFSDTSVCTGHDCNFSVDSQLRIERHVLDLSTKVTVSVIRILFFCCANCILLHKSADPWNAIWDTRADRIRQSLASNCYLSCHNLPQTKKPKTTCVSLLHSRSRLFISLSSATRSQSGSAQTWLDCRTAHTHDGRVERQSMCCM